MGEIHESVEQDDIARVQAILAAAPAQVHAILDEKTHDQPLHLAAWHNYVEIADLLIKAGADVNARGDLGRTPLHYAAYHGSFGVAQILIEHHAKLETATDYGFTPLFTAARGRSPECMAIVNLLLEHGAIVDLNTAICIGDMGRIRAILTDDPKAVPNARFPNDLIYDAVIYIGSRIWDENDERPVRAENALRVINKYRTILDLLIDHGAHVDDVGFSGWTALFEAVQMEHIAIAQTLLEHGADPNRIVQTTNPWKLAESSPVKDEMRALLGAYGGHE